MYTDDDVNQVKKYEWTLKKLVVDTIIEAGGTIFGGAVRDMYLHDIHANTFYSTYKNTGRHMIDYLKYQDKSYLPNTLGRLEIPNDIDGCISTTNIKTLFELCKLKNIHLSKRFERDPEAYIPNTVIVPGQVIHYGYTVHVYNDENLYKSLRYLFPRAMQSMPAFIDLQHKFVSCINKLPIESFNLDLMVINNISGPEIYTLVDLGPFQGRVHFWR